MSSQTNQPRRSLQFNEWKLALRKDCERLDKSRAFDSLTDPALRLLWESGLDPSVQALIESMSKNKQKPD